VKPNGKKTWRYRSKLNGKSSMFALGEYPTVKFAEARNKCEQAHKQKAHRLILHSGGRHLLNQPASGQVLASEHVPTVSK